MSLKIENDIRVNKANLNYFILILLFSFIVLEFVLIPFLKNGTGVKFAFDSSTYLYRATELMSNLDLISFSNLYDMAMSNSFGPVLLGVITSNNYYLIWLFNLVLYFICSSYLIRALKLNASYFHLLIFINMISWISIVSLNKEIFAFSSIAALIYFMRKRNIYRFMILILASFLVRSQMVLFSLVIVFVSSNFMLFKKRRKIHIILLLLMISLSLPFYSESFRDSIEYWTNSSIEKYGKGSGLYLFWIKMDVNYLYILSFPFKILHLTALNFIQFLIKPQVGLENFHNFAETLQSFSFLVVYFQMIRNKIYKSLSNDMLYISIIYFIIFGAVQIFTPRYLFPGYILLSLLLAIKDYSSINLFRYN